MKKFRELSEQHREKGRFKPTIPHNVPSTPGGTPRETSDSANVKLREAIKDKYDIGEYDQEGDMAKSDLRSIIANSKRVHDMLEDDDNLPEWVQSKITKAEDYMSTVANYMEAEMNEEVEQIDEISAETAKRVAQARDKSAANYKLTPTQSRRLKMKDVGGDPDMNAAKALKSAMKRGAKNVYGEAVKMPKQTRAEKAYRQQTGKTVDQRLSELDKIQKDLAKQKEDYIKQGIIKAEEVEQIDELKVSTLTRYGTKATQAYGRNPEKDEKRLQGIQRARAKVQQKTMKKEETEVDESIASTVGGLVGQYAGSKIGMEGPGKEHGALAGRMIDYHARKLFKKVKNVVTGQKNESVELDEAIPKSTSHALVHSSSKKIIAKGNKAEMMKKMKELNAKEKGSHHLGMTNRGKVGDTFGEEVELDEGKYGAFRVGPKSPRYPYVPQGDRDPRTGLPLGFSNDPIAKKPEDKKMKKEEVESLEEKNVPTSPEKWSRAKAMAKQKFDVYPSAYANGWAAKKYKEMGGGWKSVSEETDLEEGYFKNQEIERQETERLAKRNEPPFKADKPKKPSVVVGKKPEGYSRARQLARQAIQKYKTPVKEEKDMSKKAKVVKDIMKKSSDDKFQAKPELSDSVTRNL